jgi:hypothetical protein
MPADALLRQSVPPLRTPATQRIRTLASWGQAMCVIGIAMSAGSIGLALLNTEWRDFIVFGGLQMNGAAPLPLSDAMRQSIALSMIPPAACQAFALLSGWQLFQGFRRGEIFSKHAASRLTRIGWALFAMAPVCILIKYNLNRLMLAQQPGGGSGSGMSMALSVFDIDVSAIAFGLLAIIIGKVLAEAVRLAQENEMFI